MAEDVSKLSGTERAAILLMSLGEQDAASVLKHMDVKEVQRLGTAMASINNISRDTVDSVLVHFVEAVDKSTSMGVGNEDYLRKVLVNTVGESRANNLIDRIMAGRDSTGLDALQWMDARSVTQIVKHEHPQIIAIVLAHLAPEQSAQVLTLLPDDVRPRVVKRIAKLDTIPQTALTELDQIVETQTMETDTLKSKSVGGVRVAADILNLMDAGVSGGIMDRINEGDDDLGQQIQESLFVFENLLTVDDRGIQALIREISSDDLTLALKGSDEDVKRKFFGNMSKRAAEILQDDLEARGPVKLAEVESAQKEILTIAQRLAEEGTIMLGGGGEEYV